MAQILTVTPTVEIVDGGITVVDKAPVQSVEIEDFVETTLRISNGNDKTVACAGSEGVAVSPMAIDLAEFTGLLIETDAPLQITIEAASVPLAVGPGFLLISRGSFTTVLLANASGQAASVKLILFGNRS